MDGENSKNALSYEQLLEHYQKHKNSLDYLRVSVEKQSLAYAERAANLSRTWTGRLVLLAEKLNVDWVAVLAFAIVLSVNFWIAIYTIISCLQGP